MRGANGREGPRRTLTAGRDHLGTALGFDKPTPELDSARCRMMTLPHAACANLELMKVRDVVAMIEQDGWLLVRIRGSHHHYKHTAKPGIVTIPGSRNDDLAVGTVRSIYKQAGLTSPNRGKEAK